MCKFIGAGSTGNLHTSQRPLRMKARNCWGSKLSKGEIMAIHQISLVLVNGDISKYRIPPKCWVEMGWTGLIVIVKQVWFFEGPYVSGQEHLKAIQNHTDSLKVKEKNKVVMLMIFLLFLAIPLHSIVDWWIFGRSSTTPPTHQFIIVWTCLGFCTTKR